MQQMFLSMLEKILEKAAGLTIKQKVLSASGLLVLLVSAFVWYVVIPKNQQIRAVSEEINVLNSEINIRQVKARRLEDIKAEYAILNAQLVELEKHLPEEAEVETLLKQVSELGERNGLLITLWKPGERRPDPSGIYLEIPMAVTVSGGYHALGSFFEKVAALYRIVNISHINMGSAKQENDRFFVETTFLATTFSVSMQAPPPPQPPAG